MARKTNERAWLEKSDSSFFSPTEREESTGTDLSGPRRCPSERKESRDGDRGSPRSEIRKLHRSGTSKSDIARRLQTGRTRVTNPPHEDSDEVNALRVRAKELEANIRTAERDYATARRGTWQAEIQRTADKLERLQIELDDIYQRIKRSGALAAVK